MNIVVTGGGSGLGASIVELLAKDNNVFFTYNSSIKESEKILNSYVNTKSFKCNFKDDKSIADFIAILDKINPDILINNALVGYDQKHFHKLDAEDLFNSFKENVIPTIDITKACIKIMRKKRFGKIINILSNAIIDPPIGWSEYAANKQYLLSMSNSWANENKKFNITSNCISPSFMLTNLTNKMDPRSIEILKENSSGGEFLKVEDVAKMVSFLVSAPLNLNKLNITYKD